MDQYYVNDPLNNTRGQMKDQFVLNRQIVNCNCCCIDAQLCKQRRLREMNMTNISVLSRILNSMEIHIEIIDKIECPG